MTKEESGPITKKMYIASAGLFIIVIILVITGHGMMKGALSKVELKRSQVRNVLERQRAIENRYSGRRLSTDAEAELAGAENRVRVEIRRYDEAASSYNRRAGVFPGKIFVAVFDFPVSVRLSGEVTKW